LRYSSTAALPSKITGYRAEAAQEFFHKIAAGVGVIPKVQPPRSLSIEDLTLLNQTWQNHNSPE